MPDSAMLFADQVGSTRQLAELGGRATLAIRRRLQGLIHEAVDEHGGRVFSDHGDGAAAVFDRLEDALDAGLAMLEAAEVARSDADDRAAIHLRVGVQLGEAIVNGSGFVGLAVHVAARLCEQAPMGHLAVASEAVHRIEDDHGFRFTEIGPRLVKGLVQPIEVSIVSPSSLPAPELDQLEQPATAQPLPASSPWLDEWPTPTVWAGRVEEQRRIEAVAGLADRHTQVRLVLISGEPGIGKTSLAHRVCRSLAAQPGTLCLVGRSDERLDEPFSEVIEALRPIIETAPTELLDDHVALHGSLLTRLFPMLSARVPAAAVIDDGQAIDRFRLFEAVVDLVRALARSQRIVMLFEDLQWASLPSLELIRHLQRAAGLGPVTLIGTYRPTDLHHGEAASLLLADLAADPLVASVELEALDARDVAVLTARAMEAGGLSLDDDTLTSRAAALHRETAGSPLFVAEILQNLRESGHLDSFGSRGELVVPSTVKALATIRVDRLGRSATHVLADAAVLGRSFRLGDLERMVGEESVGGGRPPDVLAVLELAEQAGLVREERTSIEEFFHFHHDLTQNALYERIGGSRLRRKHLTAARAVAEAGGNDPQRAVEILQHLLSAGSLAPVDDVVRQAGRAAELAANKLALTEAVGYRRVVVDALSADASTDPVALARATLDLGTAQTSAGLDEGRSSMVAAAALAERADRWDIVALAAIGYGGVLKENQAMQLVSEPVDLIRRALRHHDEPTAMRARLLSALATWIRQHRPHSERRALVDEALAISRSLDDRATLAVVSAETQRALAGPNAMNEARSMADQLEDLADSVGDETIAFQALNLRLISAFALGDWDRALVTVARLEEVGDRLGSIEGRRLLLLWRSMVASMEGDFGVARKRMGDVRSLLAGYPRSDMAMMLGALSLVSQWFLGRAGESYAYSKGLGRHSTMAWFAAESGQLEAALTHVEGFGPMGRINEALDYMWWHDIVGFSRVASRAKDVDLAAELYAMIDEYPSMNATMGLVAFLGSAQHHLGTLASVTGRLDDAVAHFERAALRHAAMGARPWSALTAAELALALERRAGAGDLDRAGELVSEARSIAEPLDLRLVLELLDRP